jgi:hypothetical protein
MPPFAQQLKGGARFSSCDQLSTNLCSRPSVSSHSAETRSRYSLIAPIGSGSNENRLSRPVRVLWTIPACSSTRKCLVIACRVSFVSSVSCEMEHRRPLQSLTIKDNRVGSPSAAKTGAGAWRLFASALRAERDIAFNVLHLLRPAALIHAECLGTSFSGNVLESGLYEPKQRAACGRFQPKFD